MTDVAVVTGASRGIGRAVAIEAASRGHNVIVAYSARSDAADEVVSSIRDLGREALAVAGDLTDPGAVEQLAVVAREFGPVVLLVNNAGITNSCPLDELKFVDWEQALALNLTAPAFLSKHLAVDLRKNKGAIVNVASSGGLVGSTHSLAYGASKAGVLGLTKTLARMLAPEVCVNAVCPGMVETDLLDGVTPQQFDAILGGTPAARIASPQEIAIAVLDVARWRYCTGQSIVIDGGRVMH